MDTIVFLTEAVDLGVGSDKRVTFAGCGWHVDDHGTLHIKQREGRGNCASFADGEWSSVWDGRSLIAKEGEL